MNSLKNILIPRRTANLAPYLRLFSNSVIDPPDNSNLFIPKPQHRPNEPLDVKRSRLLYQSRKRGMLENDLLLSTFFAENEQNFSEKQWDEYDHLINSPSNDWDIYYWATNIKPVPDEFQTDIMELLQKHCKNLNREKRIRQPNLK